MSFCSIVILYAFDNPATDHYYTLLGAAKLYGAHAQRSLVAIYEFLGATVDPSADVPDENQGGIVIDSDMTDEAAIGGAVVPPDLTHLHALMRPFLRVVVVMYQGFDARVHRGQVVVHRDLVAETRRLFLAMYTLGFPIKSVIPQSQYGYVHQWSMDENNTSCYRPSLSRSRVPSEHMKAAAFDINPWVNPMDVTDANGIRRIDPAGAHYDPTALGAITKDSDLRRMWTEMGWEWGGNWGDPAADPPTDFFREGFFNYHHFQLTDERLRRLELPPGL